MLACALQSRCILGSHVVARQRRCCSFTKEFSTPGQTSRIHSQPLASVLRLPAGHGEPGGDPRVESSGLANGRPQPKSCACAGRKFILLVEPQFYQHIHVHMHVYIYIYVQSCNHR